MITNHNQLLENQEIIRPIDGVDFPLVGSAIAKALAKYLGSIYEDKTWFTNCLAQVGAKALKIEYAFDYSITNSNSLEEEALKCMLLGALENYARSRNIHEIIQPFLQGEKSLQLEAEYFKKQISYVLLDSNDTYSINQLVWFYSRQQSVFFYPTDKIFRNLQATREEFKKMILDNYHTNRLAEQNKCLYLPQ